MFSWIVFFSFFATNAEVSPLPEGATLKSYLEWAEDASAELRSLRKREQAVLLKRGGELIALSPQLQAEWTEMWDERQRNSANTRQFDRSALLELSNQFSSGTKLSLLSSYEKTKVGGLLVGGSHHLDWTAELRQSIWRNFFGRGLRSEIRAEKFRLQIEELETVIQIASKLVQIEDLFWDLLGIRQEKLLRLANQQRGRELLRWVRARLTRSAAERGDLYQAESLLTRHELELQELEDREQEVLSRWSVFFDRGSAPGALDVQELQRVRELRSLVQARDEPMNVATRLDSQLRHLQLDRSHALLDLQQDTARPDLSLVARAGTNAIRSQFSKTLSNSFKNPVYELGIFFSTPLNFGILSRLSEAAKAQIEATREEKISLQQAKAKEWVEFIRRGQNYQNRIEVADRLVRMQKKKSEEEARRYRQGRSTAFQAISFEQEAAEAELLQLQLQLRARKWEAQARFFRWDSGVFK